MASVVQRGDKWLVRVTRKGHPQINKTFSTRKDAEAFARGVEVDIERGVLRQDQGERVTLAELLQRYRNTITPTKRGARAETYRLQAFVAKDGHAKALACKLVARITSADVAHWRDDRLKAVGAGTVAREFNLLSSVFSVARLEWGYTNLLNPCHGVKKPRANNARDRRITSAELAAICEASASPELALLLRLGVETGARRGELLSLSWAGINLKARTAKLQADDTKNGHARTLPLSPEALALLQSLPRRLDGGRVFTLQPNSVSQAFRRAVARARKGYEAACRGAGVEPDTTFLIGLRFHDSRHEACSRLAERGFSTLEISAVSGHRTLQLLNRYVHLKPEALAQKLAQQTA